VKHDIAYVVIGLVIGYLVGRSSRLVYIPIVLALIGAFAGGFALHHYRYVSLLGGIVGALILGLVGTALTQKKAG